MIRRVQAPSCPDGGVPSRTQACRGRFPNVLDGLLLSLALGGCVQTYYPPPLPPTAGAVLTRDQAAQADGVDRVTRFRRLAGLQGIASPTVEQVMSPAGSVDPVAGPVPVVRIVFDDRVFFDSDSDQPLPQAAPVLDLIAGNMRRDAPDTALTVLGHTDAQGGDTYNMDLSRRRAANVIGQLVSRGVAPDQLSEIGIGKRQPVAPNDSPEGRSRNRRVEFLISSGIEANLAVVKSRDIPSSYLSPGPGEPAEATGTTVAVERASPQSVATASNGLDPYRNLVLSPPVEEEAVVPPAPDLRRRVPVSAQQPGQVRPTNAPRRIRPAPRYRFVPPAAADSPSPAPLNDTVIQ